MTRITNADHVLLLLRNHLERNEKSRRKRTPASGEKRPHHAGPLERLERLAAADDLPEPEIRRALISGLLAEEFGDEIINDPNFQQIVDDVAGLLQRDPKSEKLLSAACARLVAR